MNSRELAQLSRIADDLDVALSGSTYPDAVRQARLVQLELQDLVTDAYNGQTAVTKMAPSGFTCGWCHEHQTDFKHIKWCKKNIDTLNERKFHDAASALLELQNEMEGRDGSDLGDSGAGLDRP